jgi:exopolysaccharide production protein ExoZ
VGLSKVRSIQVLRAVAATAVVVHHAIYVVAPDTSARVGAAGVDLFFVISGFIIATVANRRSPSDFLADRIWRIFPLWLLVVTPWLIAKQPELPAVLTSLTLWPVFGNQIYAPTPGVGWSLCFEMLFYGAFALALLGWGRAVVCTFLAMLVLGSLSDSAVARYLGSPLILEFLAGTFIARLRPPNRAALPLVIAGFVWVAVAPLEPFAPTEGPEAFLRLAYWGIPAALIVYGARGLEDRFAHKAFDVPVLLGDASYSIYLFHPFVVNIGVGAAIAGSLILGLVAHRVVERPLNELRRKWRSGDRSLAMKPA